MNDREKVKRWLYDFLEGLGHHTQDAYLSDKADELLALIPQGEPVGFVTEKGLQRLREGSQVVNLLHPAMMGPKDHKLYLAPQPERDREAMELLRKEGGQLTWKKGAWGYANKERFGGGYDDPADAILAGGNDED